MQGQRIGVIGNGSWGTALVKIITDNGHAVNWWMRNTTTIKYIQRRHHNPHYLHSAYFDVAKLHMSDDVQKIVDDSDLVVIAVPSAYVEGVLQNISKESLKKKRLLSAIKGLIPGHDILLNQYLDQQFDFPLQNYFAVLGPCHAEEVAAEKLSYLTFSGIDGEAAEEVATIFRTPYINTVVNTDILGVQYAR
jgi:glycerol-3-phosphate dehydrogenase (NAD(P)+)